MRKSKIVLITLILNFITIHIGLSQCLTDEMNAKFVHDHPEEVIDVTKISSEYSETTRRATKYIIPIVFHVLHTEGPENISKEQILEQLQILNEDFSLTNPNKSDIRAPFKNLAADLQIEFRLAKIDPQGNCTDGIHRVYTTAHADARDEIKDSVPAWDYRKYMNVWTVSSIRNQNGGTGTTLGYAYLPYSTSARNDGIVMRADAVGDKIGTATYEGSTLTHEAGHYFGLLHTFQGECNDGDLNFAVNNLNLCNDDTPPVASTFTNANCSVTSNSCNTESPDQLDMWENFMDYSNGHCQSMFTTCQQKYIHYLLESNQVPRKSLYTQSNLITTGVLLPPTVTGKPVANFNASTNIVCVGDEVQFYDESCKQTVESRKWTLDGANISNTNSENPKVTYANPGNYTVSLNVSNSSGEDTKSITKYITVRPSVGYYTYLEEAVEDDSYLNEGWITEEIGGVKWARTNEAAYSGNSSFKIPINSNSSNGTKYNLDLPPLDLRVYAGINPKVSFMVGYRRADALNSEIMRIYVSTDCGQSYQQKKQIVGAGLAASGVLTSNFIPSSASDWRRINYSLNEFENDSNVLIRIEVESASGNAVYIDDINVSQYFTGIKEATNNVQFLSISPNPSNGNMSVELETLQNGKIQIALLDLTGKKVSTMYIGETTKGINTFDLSQKGNIANGVYYLQVTVNGTSSYEKISIIK